MMIAVGPSLADQVSCHRSTSRCWIAQHRPRHDHGPPHRWKGFPRRWYRKEPFVLIRRSQTDGPGARMRAFSGARPPTPGLTKRYNR